VATERLLVKLVYRPGRHASKMSQAVPVHRTLRTIAWLNPRVVGRDTWRVVKGSHIAGRKCLYHAAKVGLVPPHPTLGLLYIPPKAHGKRLVENHRELFGIIHCRDEYDTNEVFVVALENPRKDWVWMATNEGRRGWVAKGRDVGRRGSSTGRARVWH
jgi:hypothetical protein